MKAAVEQAACQGRRRPSAWRPPAPERTGRIGKLVHVTGKSCTARPGVAAHSPASTPPAALAVHLLERGSLNRQDRIMKQHKSHDAQKPNPIQLQKYLSGMDYPASKDELIQRAHEEGADDLVIETLEQLPEREYDSPTAVSREVARQH